MTEEEAKGKWCPFKAGEGWTVYPTAQSRCIASECMAWRWHKESAVGQYQREIAKGEPEGYCGAFGGGCCLDKPLR